MWIHDSSRGQSLSEYALLLAGIALALMAGLVALGGGVSDVFDTITAAFAGDTQGTSLGSEPLEIAGNFIELMQQYYDEHGRWPRSWPPYSFSDLGLDPAEWQGAINGLEYNPAGDRFGLANAIGDEYQVYVTDLNGQVLHVYDGYNVWYNFADGQWYYHDIGDQIVVDITTLHITTPQQ